MHGFIVMLLTCSAVMSFIALLYMAINPLLAKKFILTRPVSLCAPQMPPI